MPSTVKTDLHLHPFSPPSGSWRFRMPRTIWGHFDPSLSLNVSCYLLLPHHSQAFTQANPFVIPLLGPDLGSTLTCGSGPLWSPAHSPCGPFGYSFLVRHSCTRAQGTLVVWGAVLS